MRRLVLSVLACSFVVGSGFAQEQTDSSKIAPDGTAYVTRVVPVPTTISPEAQKVLARVDAIVPRHSNGGGLVRTGGRPGPVRHRRSCTLRMSLRIRLRECPCGWERP